MLDTTLLSELALGEYQMYRIHRTVSFWVFHLEYLKPCSFKEFDPLQRSSVIVRFRNTGKYNVHLVIQVIEYSLKDEFFGIFAGTAFHSTSQVVGAGFVFSEMAGKTVTDVKLIRNCFLAPVAFICTIWFGRSDGEQVKLKKASPWFLFG